MEKEFKEDMINLLKKHFDIDEKEKKFITDVTWIIIEGRHSRRRASQVKNMLLHMLSEEN